MEHDICDMPQEDVYCSPVPFCSKSTECMNIFSILLIVSYTFNIFSLCANVLFFMRVEITSNVTDVVSLLCNWRRFTQGI